MFLFIKSFLKFIISYFFPIFRIMSDVCVVAVSVWLSYTCHNSAYVHIACKSLLSLFNLDVAAYIDKLRLLLSYAHIWFRQLQALNCLFISRHEISNTHHKSSKINIHLSFQQTFSFTHITLHTVPNWLTISDASPLKLYSLGYIYIYIYQQNYSHAI